MRAPDHEGGDAMDETILGAAEDEAGDEQGQTGAEDDKKVDEKTDDKKEPDEKTGDAEDDKKEDPPANEFLGAPEGDYTITGLPDGVAVDTEVLGALTPIAKEIGLSDAGMSKLALAYNDKILPHLNTVVQKDIENQVAAQGKEWDAETRQAIEGGKDADGKVIEPLKDKDGNPVFGGKSFKEVQQIAARALDRFGVPGLREYLEASRLGNNLGLVAFAFRAGSAIKEDGFERGGGEAAPKTRVQKYYGDRATT